MWEDIWQWMGCIHAVDDRNAGFFLKFLRHVGIEILLRHLNAVGALEKGMTYLVGSQGIGCFQLKDGLWPSKFASSFQETMPTRSCFVNQTVESHWAKRHVFTGKTKHDSTKHILVKAQNIFNTWKCDSHFKDVLHIPAGENEVQGNLIRGDGLWQDKSC